MATFSTFLGLKLNQGSDPFLLADFVNNWGIIDASPGTFICTSLTRPSWSAQQAGRMIFMTDLKQLSYWSGTAWQDLRDSVPVFAAGLLLQSSMARNTSPTFTALTFTTPRPCALSIVLTGTYQCDNRQSQDVYQKILVDGTILTMGNFREQIRFEGNAFDAGGQAGANATSIAVAPSISAGSHTIGIQCDMGSQPTAVTMYGVKVMAFISLFASGNVL